LRTVIDDLKRRVFWIVARTCLTLYGWFPLFGTLRASVGVIHREGKILVIQRNDGRGLSLPGGISGWKEAEEETLRREIVEETGLSVTGKELKLQYYSQVEFPCTVSVFEVRVSGELKDSWEGSPHWMTVAELEPRFLESQRPALEVLRNISTGARVVPGEQMGELK
jgi:ADP-ribose pyrophosphatase YjhB (NUDIX family)